MGPAQRSLSEASALLLLKARLGWALKAMSTLILDRIPVLKRRTKRFALTAPLKVSGKDVQSCAFNLTSTASNLNRYGATLNLSRDLSVDSVVVLENNRHTRASARVVAQTSAVGGLYRYGVEFLEPDNVENFWGITFPSRSLN